MADNQTLGGATIRSPRTTRAHDPLTIAECTDRYPGRWILLQVLARDHRSRPAAGVVLAHCASRAALSRHLARVASAPSGGHADYYVFLAEPAFLTPTE